MNASIWVTCSCALTFGVPLGIAVRELMTLKIAGWRPPSHALPPPDPVPSPVQGERPVVQKPLPDCLIPRPARVRELA
jgi:hypothetical protein